MSLNIGILKVSSGSFPASSIVATTKTINGVLYKRIMFNGALLDIEIGSSQLLFMRVG